MEVDPFDDLLGLEDRFYNEGFQLGTLDGERAGRVEGRVFGLEKGFEKYVENGRVHGRSLVWISRSPGISALNSGNLGTVTKGQIELSPPHDVAAQEEAAPLPSLDRNNRLEKHLRMLYALTEPASLSTENSEDAVSDFDDRFKRALGRIKMIERSVGEGVLLWNPKIVSEGGPSNKQSTNGGEANIEDVGILKARP